MLELLQQFFLGHCHQYEETERVMVRNHNGTAIEAIIIVQTCKKCGKIQQVKIQP